MLVLFAIALVFASAEPIGAPCDDPDDVERALCEAYCGTLSCPETPEDLTCVDTLDVYKTKTGGALPGCLR